MENKPVQTPTEDLRKSALKHYEEAASNMDYYNIRVLSAIHFYFDMISDKPLSREDIEAEGLEIYEIKDKEYSDYYLRYKGKVVLGYDPNDIEQNIEFGGDWVTIKNRAQLSLLLKQLRIK